MSENSVLPAGTLILHTPWFVGEDGEYIGLITNQNYIQCGISSELKNVTPRVTDCYLAVGRFKDWQFDQDPTEDLREHTHSTTHWHNDIQIRDNPRPTFVDKNNSGSSTQVSPQSHSHEVSLDRYTGEIYGADPNPTSDIPLWKQHDPQHYEVNGYYIEEDQRVVLGTLAFLTWDLKPGADEPKYPNLAGWKCLNAEPLKKAKSDTGSYYPIPWENVLLKVVGCWPSKARLGNKTHKHEGARHSHTSGRVSESFDHRPVDNSDADYWVADRGHSHEITTIRESSEDEVSEAPNLPYSRNLLIYVAIDRSAVIHKGMIFPYLPKNNMTLDQKSWSFLNIDNPDPSLPTYLKCKEVEEMGKYSGENVHVHAFRHSHLIDTGPANKAEGRGGEPEYDTVLKDHEHRWLLTDTIITATAPNPLKRQVVAFIVAE